jgi:hypothetical protein
VSSTSDEDGRDLACVSAAAVDRDSLRDGDGTVPGRIQGIDFTALYGLGNRAGKRFAGSGAAAGVRVVANARNPGATCLRLRGCRQRAEAQREGNKK